jgi:hypothetical protein
MVAMALGVKILPGLIVPVAVALSFLSRVIEPPRRVRRLRFEETYAISLP